MKSSRQKQEQTRNPQAADEPHSHLRQQSPVLGGLAGMAGGLAGVLAMTALQLFFDHLQPARVPASVRQLSQRGGRHDIARLKTRARWSRLPQRDATVRAAERLSYFVRGARIPGKNRHIAGVAVHYAFGALTGAAYGFAAEKYPTITIASGLPFGAGVWLFAEEVALPAANLSDSPAKYPLRDHLNALTAHLVFGLAAELTRRRTRDLLATVAQRDHTQYSRLENDMTEQKTPHTQTQQNTKPEQSDFEPDQTDPNTEDGIYAHMEGAETGSDRAPRKLQTDAPGHNTEPETSAHEGSVTTRTPKRPVQGITSHSAQEESERQEKVVNDRPDASAGVNRSK